MLPINTDGTDPNGPGGPNRPQISLYDINVELKNSPTAQIGMNDTRVRQLAGVSSGTISMFMFYGKYCRTIYRATAYNGTAGTNSGAYDGGDGEAFNQDIYTTTSSYAEGNGTYTYTGKPTTLRTGVLRIRALAIPYDDGGSISPSLSNLPSYLYYNIGSGNVLLATLTTTSTEYSVNLTNVNPNSISVVTTGTTGSGGNLRLGNDWSGHSVARVYDILFAF